MRVVVRIDCLRFKARNRIKLLDRCRTEARERSEDCALDFCHLRVLHSIDEGVL